MANEAKNVQVWHPLFRKDIRVIGSWEEWKEQWEKAVMKEELLGLLHCGFSFVRDVTLSERACLYLEVANGYRKTTNLELGGEEKQRDSWNQRTRFEPVMRQEVAQKALRMLVDKLFTNTCNPNRHTYIYYPSWAYTVADPAVLGKLFWFFSADRFSYAAENNLPDRNSDKHDDVVLQQFIKDFVRFCWQFHGFEGIGKEKINDQVAKALKGFRPQLLELMHVTGQLWYLAYNPRSLDKASSGKLRDMALRVECYTDGPYATLEEAWVVGHRLAAMLLLMDPIWKKELERQEKLKKVKELQQEVEYLKREASQP